MNNKEVKLLDALMAASSPLTSQTLSEQLNISSRTVKRMVWTIDEELRKNGAELLSNKNGYEVHVVKKELFDDFWNEQKRLNDEMSLESEAEFLIMKHLLLNKYCTQDELADLTFVSRSTVNKYIKNIKTVLGKEKIQLGNRPHFGYYLIAEEADIRNYMVKLLLPEGDPEEFDEDLIRNCRNYAGFIKELEKLLEKNGYQAGDRRCISVMKYFIVVAIRTANKCPIDVMDEKHFTEYDPQLTQTIRDLMERYFAVSLEENELVYLLYVLGYSGNKKENDERDLSFYDDAVTEFFTEIKEVYQQDFFFDPILRQGLVQHLYSCYSQMLINSVIDNPLIQVIKTQYVEAYNYAKLCGDVLRERYEIEATEDSLGYIALHFAAAIERMNSLYKFNAVIVCESGFGMAELLKMTITNRIKSIVVTKTVSSKELYEMDLSDIAMVITSVKLKQKISKPVIEIDPLQLESDIEKIESYLKDCINIPQYKGLFSRKRFFPKMNFENKENLLRYMSETLIDMDIINIENETEILKREEISSTEINKYCAIPHCIVESNNETLMSIATLKKPMIWGKEKVSIIFLACIARKSSLNRKLFPLIYKLTYDEDKCRKLLQMDSFEEFLDLLFSDLPVDYGN